VDMSEGFCAAKCSSVGAGAERFIQRRIRLLLMLPSRPTRTPTLSTCQICLDAPSGLR
jgi:hypothetical protein